MSVNKWPIVLAIVLYLCSHIVGLCEDYEFICKDGSCVGDFLRCDGAVDCADGSDEQNCGDFHCPLFAFRCRYGGCVSGIAECNGVKDCMDNSDEESLKCPGVKESLQRKGSCLNDDYFQCTDGTCIFADQVCNGKKDCPDGSEETARECATYYCPSYAFRCAYGGCITGIFKCNGVNDCVDGSDEAPSVCGNATRPTTIPPTIPPSSGSRPWGSCSVPLLENGQVVNIFGKIYHPGRVIQNGEQISYQCIKSVISGETKGYCINGTLIGTTVKCVKDGCPTLPLFSLSVEAECLDEQLHKLTCEEKMPVGTTARLSCKSGYKKPDRHVVSTVHCTQDGHWSSHIYKCDPICGEVTDVVPFIIGGREANITLVPWHAAIYQHNGKKFEQICGGSILSTNAILSAAHCFYDDIHKRNVPSHLFEVIVGKSFRDYNTKESGMQVLQVHEIISHPAYSGLSHNFQADVSVLVLKQSIIYHANVKPICINFDLRGFDRGMRPGLIGRVAGWGSNEQNVGSPHLKVVELPAVDYFTCRDKSESAIREFIGSDKFCAGNRFNETVCRGDSGGGFVEQVNIGGVVKYFLCGLVSLGARALVCQVTTYTFYTNVHFYEDLFYNYTRH